MLWGHRKLLGVFSLVLGLLVPLSAAEPPGGKVERKVLPLWLDKAPGAIGNEELDRPTLTVHLPEPATATGTGVIVCPGGGYVALASDHEGQQVARWLNSVGIAAFVLKYRLKPRYQPADALRDGKQALRYVRHHAPEFGISPKRVGILGFSAGSHLAACTVLDFDAGDSKVADPVARQSCRPDFMVLVYGGATALGDPAQKNQGKGFTAQAPPAFLVSTDGDKATDRVLDCYGALRKVGVPAEVHVFGGYGPHGTGLAPGDPAIGAWPQLLLAWLRKSGLLTSAERAAIVGRVLIDGKPLHRGWVTFVPLDSARKPVACCFFGRSQEGKFRLLAGDGPCVGPHRVEVRMLSQDVPTVPTLEDAVLFTKARKEDTAELHVDIKPGENTLDLDLRSK